MALIIGGTLGVIIACIHGVLGAKKIVAPAKGLSSAQHRILHAIMLLSALYWATGGAALIWAGLTPGHPAAFAIWATTLGLYATGSLANAWATRGRHFGWILLAITCAVIALGKP